MKIGEVLTALSVSWNQKKLTSLFSSLHVPLQHSIWLDKPNAIFIKLTAHPPHDTLGIGSLGTEDNSKRKRNSTGHV
jgi:hypothetical protein